MKWYIFTVIIFTVKWFILNLGREIAEIIKGMVSLVPCCYILPACLPAWQNNSRAHILFRAIREAKPTPESGLYRWAWLSHARPHNYKKKSLLHNHTTIQCRIYIFSTGSLFRSKCDWTNFKIYFFIFITYFNIFSSNKYFKK